MTVDSWVLGVAFSALVIVQALWGMDCVMAVGRRAFVLRRWRPVIRSGTLYLGLFNLTTGGLHGWFAWITFSDPFQHVDLGISLVVIAMSVFATLAWFFLPRPGAEK